MPRQFAGFSVRDIRVENPLILAPMEDVSNLAFRLIAKRIANPGLMFTEFVSAMAIHYNPGRSKKKMRIEDEERPLGIQIFGADPEKMAESAQVAEEMGADIVDINMGCWVPKVCRQGSGAALLKDPETAEAIVKAVVKAVKVPVTVKVRAGWNRASFAAPDLARRFQDAGISMLTLHARFAEQGFEGSADWDLLSQLREVVSVPLIGNGDVKTPEDAIRMIERTGVDGVMVGRAAISNPWLFGRIGAALRGAEIPSEPTIEDRVKVALEHARLMVEHESDADGLDAPTPQVELRAIRALRGQLPLYIKSAPGSSQTRARLSIVSSLAELEEILTSWLESQSDSSCP